MDRLVGRISEKKKLENALVSDKPELIAVYGRRRVGKTFLIRQAYKKHISFELTGLHNGTLTDQLENFHYTLSRQNSKYSLPQSWMEAFYQLSEFIDSIKAKKKVVFIDEFPWLATRRSKFLMAFENFWNSYAAKKNDLVVVICGSAASYMIKNIVRNKGGLHNRITEKIRLLPFTLIETKAFLKSKKIQFSHYDILRIYMALGGVPHYLDKIHKGESVAQAIDRLCFEKDAPLRSEFNDIFASLFENYERHKTIVSNLASSRKGMTRSQIGKKSGITTGGRLTRTLDELEESGFIASRGAYGNVTKDSLYRLDDEYCMFYLKFIEKSKASGQGTWLSKVTGQSFTSWSGFAFETICLKHIESIKSALGISAVNSEFANWTQKNENKGAQIDLLIDRADGVINVCEMKFHRAEFKIDKSYATNLRNKLNLFRESTRTKKNLFLTLITTFGLVENQYSLELIQNELTIDDLFKSIK